jgi:hypothetical protein
LIGIIYLELCGRHSPICNCTSEDAPLNVLQGRSRARFAENEIVAIVLALPEPFAVLALMNRGIEFGGWKNLVAPDEASLVAKALEIRKHILNRAGREVPIFALENQQWRVLSQNPQPRSAGMSICEHANPAWRSGPSTLSLRSSYAGHCFGLTVSAWLRHA